MQTVILAKVGGEESLAIYRDYVLIYELQKSISSAI